MTVWVLHHSIQSSRRCRVHPTYCLICAQVRARLLVVGTSHGPQHLRVRREKRRERAGRALLGRGNEERRRAGRRARASLCLVGVACVDAVSRAIRSVDGVLDASVSVGSATVSVNNANDAMAASISDAVRKAGFPPDAVRWGKI